MFGRSNVYSDLTNLLVTLSSTRTNVSNATILVVEVSVSCPVYVVGQSAGYTEDYTYYKYMTFFVTS